MGETRQLLRTRLDQHKYDVKKNKDSTALADHSKEKGHNFNFDKVRILARESGNKKRKLREMIEITKYNDAINFKTDVQRLSGLYGSLVKKYGKINANN